jgi:hypothetical protein
MMMEVHFPRSHHYLTLSVPDPSEATLAGNKRVLSRPKRLGADFGFRQRSRFECGLLHIPKVEDTGCNTSACQPLLYFLSQKCDVS